MHRTLQSLGKIINLPTLVVTAFAVASVVLVSLENIQEHLEDPFDLIGEDDVVIDVEKFIARLDA